MAGLFSVPDGQRFQLGIYGRRNVGKSSTFNALARQELAIVSEVPGSTTDPVMKAVELPKIGPTLLIDVAGIDDVSELGASRVAKTRATYDRVDAGLVLLDGTLGISGWSQYEESIVSELSSRGVAVVVCVNKRDISQLDELAALVKFLDSLGLSCVVFSAKDSFAAQNGVREIVDKLVSVVPENALTPPPLIADLLEPSDMVVLVVPVDVAAPKGRLILPQVQTLREILDYGALGLVAQPPTLAQALSRLTTPPKLVVTDSQAFAEVAQILPLTAPLTSFSILLARQKWNLQKLTLGARALESLTSSSRVLIAEGCSHHPTSEDIGTVKLPRALRRRFGESLAIEHVHGADFPDVDALSAFDLVIHCGGCVLNRRQTRARLARAEASGTPITNYGLALAYFSGILDRALEPFGL